jgi:hypothetical protein
MKGWKGELEEGYQGRGNEIGGLKFSGSYLDLCDVKLLGDNISESFQFVGFLRKHCLVIS